MSLYKSPYGFVFFSSFFCCAQYKRYATRILHGFFFIKRRSNILLSHMYNMYEMVWQGSSREPELNTMSGQNAFGKICMHFILLFFFLFFFRTKEFIISRNFLHIIQTLHTLLDIKNAYLFILFSYHQIYSVSKYCIYISYKTPWCFGVEMRTLESECSHRYTSELCII